MQPTLSKRKQRTITAKICGREKSYGNFLYVHIPKEVVTALGWNAGDITRMVIREEDDSLTLKRVFKAEE